MKKKEIDAKLDAIIDFSGVEKYIDTPIKRYSSGMAVRLGFAVASHLNCDILIADEVLAVGDIEFQKKALSKMDDLSSSEGRTILFVSHNLLSVRALCNKGVILEKGRLISTTDNIGENISKYIESNIKFAEKIPIETAEIDKSIELHEVLVNGKNLQNVQYKFGEKLKIEIKGKTKIAQPICLELMIKSEFDAPLAYYNRFGHFVLPKIIEVGDFYITEEIEIPNIITGRYFVKMYIVNPGVAILFKLDNAFMMVATGITSLSNTRFVYDDVGFIKIE